MRKKITTKEIRSLKGKRPIASITAYDYLTAKLAGMADMDLILVGDSVGTTLLGFDTTVPVTVDMMLHHCQAVSRANVSSLVVGDLPFSEGAMSIDSLIQTCKRFMQEGRVDAVKIECSFRDAEKIEILVRAGIPVLGHIGLLPQTVQAIGGYRKFGKTEAEQEALIKDAKALEDAGCFCLIGEMIDDAFMSHLTESVSIPVIGIGCGPMCDGQILVSTDLLGMDLEQKPPSFVKQYEAIGERIKDAFLNYKNEVLNKKFPVK
jgi:3-methyl-2-oxobutanoate hydroxymethyltransferase